MSEHASEYCQNMRQNTVIPNICQNMRQNTFIPNICRNKCMILYLYLDFNTKVVCKNTYLYLKPGYKRNLRKLVS